MNAAACLTRGGCSLNAQSSKLQITRGSSVSDHFDMIRGMAALGVLFNHLRYLFLVDYTEVVNANLATRAFYLATALGHQMVMVFFVLSGYFIASSVIRDLQKGRWSWDRYVVNRGVRLYVVLIPALLLTLGWDQLGIAVSGNAPVYQGLGQDVVSDVHLKSSLTDLLGNATFVQTLLVPTFGSNGPLWSLSNEFWYYMIFPCSCLLAIRGTSLLRRLLVLAIGIGVLYVSYDLLDLFPIWLLGAALAFAPRWKALENNFVRCGLLATALPVFLFLVCARPLKILSQPLVADYLVGLAFAAVVYLMLHAPQTPSHRAYAFVAQHLAGMSYTLYLVHLPILAFAAATLGLSERWQPTWSVYGFMAGLSIVVLVYAWVISRLTEARTERYRVWFVSLIGQLNPALPTRSLQPVPADL